MSADLSARPSNIRGQIRIAVRASKSVSSESDLLRERMLSNLQKRLSMIGGKLRLVADFPDGRRVTMTLKGRIVSISGD